MDKKKTYTLDEMIAMELYVYVAWPENQNCMEKEWFDEEAVMDDNGGMLIPVGRAVEMKLLF